MTTYLIVSVVINLAYAATGLFVGRVLRLWTGG
jgi:hypothetical protein